MDAIDEASERMLDRFSDTEMVNGENIDYYRENRASIAEDHGGDLIAVIDGEVASTVEPPESVDAAVDFVEELEREYGRERMQAAYITFVPQV